MIQWISFLQSIDCDVIIHPWGDCFAYSCWMLPDDDPHWSQNRKSRLPVAGQRDDMVRSLADFLLYLRRDKQLLNVRYVCLMNEPDNDHRRPTPVAEFVRLNRLLAQCLKERGLEKAVMLLGPDDCTGQASGTSLWWQQTVPQIIDVLDGFSSHTYKHRDTRLLPAWVHSRLTSARQLDPLQSPRPLLVTEFGYTGLTGGAFDNPENESYEYGLFMGDFAIGILNSGASAALNWCLFDQYYDNTHCQHYGLWKYKDQNWEPRPAFYSWSIITRCTAAHSRVFQVTVAPAAENLRAAAMVAPNGTMTLMIVNRYHRELQITVCPSLTHAAEFDLFRYHPAELASATRRGLSPAQAISVSAPGSVKIAMPAESFALIVERTRPPRTP